MGTFIVFAPERKSIQCHLWHCEKAYQPYCSSSHSELATRGEEGKNAIVIADGLTAKEIYEISSKIVRSKEQRQRCGIPHVDPNSLCMNPSELDGFVFNRELEMEERRRSWVFFCENNPEGFGAVWKLSGASKEVSVGIFRQNYVLQRAHVSTAGTYLLTKITGRFSVALYWMKFLAAELKVESEEEGKVTVETSEGETSKRKPTVCETSQLPNKMFKGEEAKAPGHIGASREDHFKKGTEDIHVDFTAEEEADVLKENE